jgi:hypothetical protein
MKLSVLKYAVLRGGAAGFVALSLWPAIGRAGTLDAGLPAGASVADPQPVPITILQSSPQVAAGFNFVTPAGTGSTAAIQGPEIVDNQGRPVWFDELPSNAR